MDDDFEPISAIVERLVQGMGVARPGVTPARPIYALGPQSPLDALMGRLPGNKDFPGASDRAGAYLRSVADCERVSFHAARHSGTAAGTEKGAPGRGEEGTQPGAGHRAEGGGGGTILQFRRRSGAAGPKRPPRQSAIDTVTDGRVALSGITPATGGLGDARKREGA